MPVSSSAPTILPISFIVASPDQFPYPLPSFRYQEWSALDETSQEIAAEKLRYTPISWNVGGGGANPIEKKEWDELYYVEQLGAVQLGFNKNTWDCFMDHYRSLTWDQLRAARPAVYQSYWTLGWTRAQWDGDAAYPTSDDKWWAELTDRERTAANALCYFEANWDGVDMNPNPSFFPYPLPEALVRARYLPFGRLSPQDQRAARTVMGYTAASWNLLHTSPIERNTVFYDLSREQREWASDRGLYSHTWNCHMHHFNSFSWGGFHGRFRVAVETLGWSAGSWESEPDHAIPASEGKDWSELSPRERAAATMLCYFAEAWDGVPVTEWFDADGGANTAVSPGGALPAGIDMSLFAEARRGPRGGAVFH